MKIVKIKYRDMQGTERIIDKQENKFTYKTMLENFNLIYFPLNTFAPLYENFIHTQNKKGGKENGKQ